MTGQQEKYQRSYTLSYTVLFAILAIALLASGCLKLDEEKWKEYAQKVVKPTHLKPLSFGKITTFEDGFEQAQRIEKKFEIDFKHEQLYKNLVREEFLDLAIGEYQRLRDHVIQSNNLNVVDYTPEKLFEVKSYQRTDLQVFILFIDARIEMLNSQKAFYGGYRSGSQGLVGDGFFCREKLLINDSLNAFNQSAFHAGKVYTYFDELLTGTPNMTWQFVGVGPDKPKFYNSLLAETYAQVKVDREVLWRNCAKEGPRSKVFVSMEKMKKKNLFTNPTAFFVQNLETARQLRESNVPEWKN